MKSSSLFKFLFAFALWLSLATGAHAVIINGGSLTYVGNSLTNGSLSTNTPTDSVTLSVNASSYFTAGATLPETLTLSPGTSVTLSFSFQQTEGSGGFRIGLFNNNGTPLPAETGSSFDSLASNDYGIFASFTSTSSTSTYDAGTNGNLFFGTDRTNSSSGTYTAIGSTLHTASITYELDAFGNTNITVVKDSTTLYTSAFTITGNLSFNEIAFLNDSNNATAKTIVFSNLQIESIPEPSALALVGIAGFGLLLRHKKQISLARK